MNCKKNIFFFILFLLSTISFTSWAQPYVRVEELNQTGSWDYSYSVWEEYYATPTIKLYADEACTIPYTTTSDFEVTILQENYNGTLSRINSSYNYDNTNFEYFTVTIPAGNSSYSLTGSADETIRISSYYNNYSGGYNLNYSDYDNDPLLEDVSTYYVDYSVYNVSNGAIYPTVKPFYQNINEFNINYGSFSVSTHSYFLPFRWVGRPY